MPRWMGKGGYIVYNGPYGEATPSLVRLYERLGKTVIWSEKGHSKYLE